MSIILSDLSYHYPNESPLFSGVHATIAPGHKVSVTGSNGTGKSTLLQLIAGILTPDTGQITCDSRPYYVPQQYLAGDRTIAEALGIAPKLAALEAITNGSVAIEDYDTLADDWDIEARYATALAYWQLPELPADTPMQALSNGQQTKVMLAGITLHQPPIILLDEPTNHLDQDGREILYRLIAQQKAIVVVVSHDITLLNELDTTYELSARGLQRYGGNYDFYRVQKDLEENALEERIQNEEKQLRQARKKAREVAQNQDKRARQGEKDFEGPRIFKNTLRNAAESTAARLRDQHSGIVENSAEKLSALRKQQNNIDDLKIDFDNASLHKGKLLVQASAVNYAYTEGQPLWKQPIDFSLYSNDRVHITGRNGAGKTTLLQLLTGALKPTTGSLTRNPFSWICLEQDYEVMNDNCTIAQMAQRYNHQHLEQHEINIRLNRFLFGPDTWHKRCSDLSGGEKMRLYLCCLMIGNHTPDLIILDEPTNNLDIPGIRILTQTIRQYQGSLLVISHDKHFVSAIGVDKQLRVV
jgi:ATPase subunit of ABC transporter with duplicated ATPase domains